MPSSKNNPSTAYKPNVVPDGLAPATVIRPGRGSGVRSDASDAAAQNSSTIGNLFPEDGQPLHANLSEGTKLDCYVVEERIGAGGMGAVFRAHDESLGRTVALKILSPSQTGDPSSVKRFQNEARAAARLDHENIARIYTVGEAHNLYYIAFEYIEGKTVRELIREQKTLDSSQTINFILQIALALKHTAQAGVVHRDIKPSNLIMMPNSRAKLVDWGLARKESLGTQSNDLTVSGTTLGTFDYISPEQARDPRNVDARSDIYSLGCTAYHMLTGSPPYAEGTVLQKLLDHQGKPAPECREKNPSVPAELSRIVRKMMASNAEDRYQTPQSLVHDLLALASESGLRPVHPDGLTWQNGRAATAGSQSNSLLWWWLAAFTVACSVAIVSDYWGANPQANSKEDLTEIFRKQNDNQGGLPSVSATTNYTEQNLLSPSMTGVTPESPFNNIFGSEDKSYPPGHFLNVPSPIVQSMTTQLQKNEPKSDSWGLQNKPLFLGAENSPEKEAGYVGMDVSDAVSISDTNNSMMQNRVPETANTQTNKTTFRVLASDGEFLRSADLETALSEVPDGGVIEFAPNQGETRVYLARQLRILDKAILLRAAANSRLIIQFNTDKIGASSRYRDLILVKGGSLTISNVDLQVAVPQSFAQPWSLFTIEGPGKLRCRKSTMTIQSEYQTAASVVKLMHSPLQSIEPMKPEGTAQKVRGQIEFEDCFLRGACDLVHAETSESAALNIRNSVITIDGALVRYSGDNNIRNVPQEWNIRLSRVAAIASNGLLRTELGTTIPKQNVETRVRADDCLFLSQTELPFIQMVGGQNVDELQKMFWWEAENNLYAGWSQMMVLRGPASIGAVPRKIEFRNSSQSTIQHEEFTPHVLTRNFDYDELKTRIDQWDIAKLQALFDTYQSVDSTDLDFSKYGPNYKDLPTPLPQTKTLPTILK